MQIVALETQLDDHVPAQGTDQLTMKAITRDRYGLPDVLRLREVARPSAGAHEVLVRVHASSVNFADWVMLTGTPHAARLVFGLFRPRHPVLGRDIAGRVVAVGPGVTRFAPGDEVFGEFTGAYAEYVRVPERCLARKPSNLSFEEAATLPVAAMPALQGLRDKAKIRPGHRVLINGASGGVGSFAVQIAKALGAEVTGVCSTSNCDWVRKIGADHVVDYTREDFTRTSRRYDAIFDAVGSAPIAACTRILSRTGVYVSSVGRMGWSLKALFASLLPGSQVVVLAARSTPRDLTALAELIEAGAVKPVIDRRYTLDEVPGALRRQGEGHARGKSVITVLAP